MKSLDTILLVGILTTFLLVTLTNTPQSFASDTLKLGGITVSDTEQNKTPDTTIIASRPDEKNITTALPFMVEPDKDLESSFKIYKTKTGLDMGIGLIYNRIDNKKDRNITVTIPNGNETIIFNITMKEDDVWCFCKIKDLLIVPAAPNLMVDPFNTSYYEMGNQLRIGLIGEAEKKNLIIYAKERPSRVVADVNTKWNYDYKTKKLEILLPSFSNHTIIIDWTYYPFRDVLFVEDTTRVEELNNKIMKLEENNNNIDIILSNLTAELNNLKNEAVKINLTLNETESETEKINNEISIIENNITDLNETNARLENKIAEKVIITPLQLILIIIIFLIPTSYIIFFWFVKSKKVSEYVK